MKYIHEYKYESVREVQQRGHTGGWKVRENFRNELGHELLLNG